MEQKFSKWISILAGAALLLGGAAATGYVIAEKKMFPYYYIKRATQIAGSLIRYGSVMGDGLFIAAPENASREVVTVHDPDKVMGEGFYALMGWDAPRSAYSVQLFGADGELVHSWPLNEEAYTPTASHTSNGPHGMEVLPDGSLVVNFDNLPLMVRVDACGDSIWAREEMFHHVIAPANDGNLWSWWSERSHMGQLQDIVKFDPETGEDLLRISLANDIITRSPESALLFSMFQDFPFVPDNQGPRDIFHPNDVEELTPEMADAFDMFEAGDLLLSLRELDMILVTDQEGNIKWTQTGPWLEQHDPDFHADGTIVVYDNSRFRPRSALITIDPTTRAVENPIPGLERPFKSSYRGKQQLLPNGNMLLLIPEQGQVLELAGDGSEVVMEFNNVAPGDPAFNMDIANAEWLPQDYFTTLPSCSR